MSIRSGSPSAAVSVVESGLTGDEGGGEIVLFGVRVKVDPMRKTVSMNNLSEYETIGKELLKPVAEGGGTAGYSRADDAVPPERKRGVPWTEEEHKLFLLGLHKVGKGDWRGISRNYVKTRTPTQVASHAQKYFIRQSNLKRCRRRSSLFDITTDSVNATPMEEVKSHEDVSRLPGTSNISVFPIMPFPMAIGTVLLPMENSGFTQSGDCVSPPSALFMHQVPLVPIMPTPSLGMTDFSSNQKVQPLSLSLSLSSGPESLPTNGNGSSFQVMSSFENGDGTISVS